MGNKSICKNSFEDIDTTFDALREILSAAKRLVNSGRVDPGRMKELAGYVVRIRSLLKELEQIRHSPDQISSRLSIINDLQKDYLDLEGIVKEFRNDFC